MRSKPKNLVQRLQYKTSLVRRLALRQINANIRVSEDDEQAL